MDRYGLPRLEPRRRGDVVGGGFRNDLAILCIKEQFSSMHSMNFHTSFSTSKSSRPVQPTHAPLYLITTGATAVTNPPALEESREVGVNIFVTSSLINVLILFSISEQSLFYLAFLKRLPSSACRFRTKGRRLETTMMGASCSEESSPSLPPASEYAPLNRGSRAASRAHNQCHASFI